MARSTKAEKEKRVIEIQKWIIEGKTDANIIRDIKSEWDIGLRMARNYIKLAYDAWLPMEQIKIENRRAAKIAELKEELRGLKKKYQGTPQGMNARARLHKMLIKLEDIEPPQRHHVTGEMTHSHDVLNIDPLASNEEE